MDDNAGTLMKPPSDPIVLVKSQTSEEGGSKPQMKCELTSKTSSIADSDCVSLAANKAGIASGESTHVI